MSRATSAAAATSASAGSKQRARDEGRVGYLERSERPLASLVFLLPLIVFYELGTRGALAFAGVAGVERSGGQQIVAFALLQQFFALFGASVFYLPALAVVGILLTWHIARNDPWKVRPSTLAGMGLESLLLVIPLLVMGIVLARYFPRLPLAAPPPDATNLVLLSVGAGIYEELVFRLILCTALSVLLANVLRVPTRTSNLLLVLISAVAFSAYHYLGSEVFQWRNFAFRTGAGIYFGTLFLVRGFGITASCHAIYDVFILLV